MAEREVIIGIDLGTTNSVVASVQEGQPVVVKSRSGSNLTPSIVAVTPTGKRLVGSLAKRQAVTNPVDTVFAAKRLIGRKFSSPQVQDVLRRVPYQVVAGLHDDVRIRMGGRDVALPEISALILRELKADAEAWAGAPVTKAVVTVPAYFNDGQRQATKDAGAVAGLDVLRILNEPTAAALAYGLGKTINGKIAVFDLGGGTFDISVLEVADGVFEVVATGGDTFLGGEDFDHRVVEWLAAGFQQLHGVDLRKDRQALQRLKDAAEKAKIDLSTEHEAKIGLPFLSAATDGGGALHLQTALSRAQLESLCGDLVQRTVALCDQVLREAHVRPVDLKEVVLVGGMTRMPKVVEAVRAYFQREPCAGVNPDEVVALGAAVQASSLMESTASNVVLLDVTPLSLGVAIAGGYVRRLIPKNTTLPTATTEVFNTSRDGQTTVKIHVLQGESDVAHENELLGEFTLGGLREARRGEVQVEVTFEISSDGLVSVSARDRETGNAQTIAVAASGGLTRDELLEVMESHADYLLEARTDEELGAKHAALEKALATAMELLPAAQALVGQGALAPETFSRAQAIVKAGRQILEQKNLPALADAVDKVGRVVTVLQAAVHRVAPPRSK